MRFLAIFLLAVLLFCVSIQGVTQTQRREKIIGTIVAYQGELVAHGCFDSICGASVIVRLDRPKQSRAKYVRVDFAYADNTSPYEALNANKRWRLTVIRSQDHDVPLKRFFELEVEGTKQKSETAIPMWILVLGAENEGLPYGEVLPSYQLAKNLTKEIWRRM